MPLIGDNPRIDAGKLDRRVTLARPTYNTSGDEIEDWEVVGEVWAGVYPALASEVTQAGRLVARTDVIVVIRYRADIDARWRILDRERCYEVRALADIASRRTQLQLSCEQVI